MREAGRARSWGLGCRLRLGRVGSRQGAVIFAGGGRYEWPGSAKWLLPCIFLDQ